jgi:excisionase family DNA binding protein
VTLKELPEVLTIEQVAEYLGVGRSTMYDAARRGDVKCVRLGRRLLVPKARLEDFLTGEIGEEKENGGPTTP